MVGNAFCGVGLAGNGGGCCWGVGGKKKGLEILVFLECLRRGGVAGTFLVGVFTSGGEIDSCLTGNMRG